MPIIKRFASSLLNARPGAAAPIALAIVLLLPTLITSTAAGDEEDLEAGGKGTRTIRVSAIGPAGRTVRDGVCHLYFEGPRLNSAPWFETSEPVTPSAFVSAEGGLGSGRSAPKIMSLEDGVVTTDVPVRATRAWVEVWGASIYERHRARPCGAIRVGPVEIEPGRTLVHVELPVARSIAGRIEVPDQAPPADHVRVLATPVRPHFETPFPWWIGTPHASVEVRRDGTFTVDGLGGFRYVLEVVPPRVLAPPDPIRVDLRNEVVAALPATIPLVRSIAGRVRVLERSSGILRPVAGAQVRVYWTWRDGVPRDIRGATMDDVWRRSDDDGYCNIHGLSPTRSYSLFVLPPQSRGGVERSLRLKTWDPNRELNLTLPGER